MIKYSYWYYPEKTEKEIRNFIEKTLLQRIGLSREEVHLWWKKDILNKDTSIRRTCVVTATKKDDNGENYYKERISKSYTIKPWLNEKNCLKFEKTFDNILKLFAERV